MTCISADVMANLVLTNMSYLKKPQRFMLCRTGQAMISLSLLIMTVEYGEVLPVN